MMTVSNMHSLYEMDKGTLSKSGIKALKDELKEKHITKKKKLFFNDTFNT